MDDIQIQSSGPLFSKEADHAARQYAEQVHEDMAKAGKSMVDNRLPKVLQHPTGYYQSQIRSERNSAFQSRVHDGDVIYGPWLEGTGSRNYPVTRFKGYHTFRIIASVLRMRAKYIAGQALPPFLRRMN